MHSIKYSKIWAYSTMGLLALSMSAAAHADEVHLTGSTQGRFNADPFGANDSLLALSFSNSIFDNDTVGGALDLGGNPNPGSNFNNLGSFTLLSVNNTYNGNFDLMVTFTAPLGIAGGGSGTFTDHVTGTVSNGNGGVFIDFDNTPQTFTFSNGTSTGSFSMFVNDVSIAPGQDVSLTAHVMGSQQAVPEPAGLVGVFVGAFALVSLARRRR